MKLSDISRQPFPEVCAEPNFFVSRRSMDLLKNVLFFWISFPAQYNLCSFKRFVNFWIRIKLSHLDLSFLYEINTSCVFCLRWVFAKNYHFFKWWQVSFWNVFRFPNRQTGNSSWLAKCSNGNHGNLWLRKLLRANGNGRCDFELCLRTSSDLGLRQRLCSESVDFMKTIKLCEFRIFFLFSNDCMYPFGWVISFNAF